MSIISVDFPNLENQIKRLTLLAETLEGVSERVKKTINDVSDMELGDNEDDLKISYKKLSAEKEHLFVCIRKLERILELYRECEDSILSDIRSLPLNMSEDWGTEAVYKALPVNEFIFGVQPVNVLKDWGTGVVCRTIPVSEFIFDMQPVNVSEDWSTEAVYKALPESEFIFSEAGVFAGHFVVNEDWLENLIYKKGRDINE